MIDILEFRDSAGALLGGFPVSKLETYVVGTDDIDVVFNDVTGTDGIVTVTLTAASGYTASDVLTELMDAVGSLTGANTLRAVISAEKSSVLGEVAVE